MKKLLIILGVIIGVSSVTYGATIAFPPFGGTGIGTATVGDVGKYLKVSDDSPFTYIFDTPAGGSGVFEWTPTTYNGVNVNATSTGIWFKGTSPFSIIATSTFFTRASTTQLTNTGSTWLTSLLAGGLGIDSNGLVYSGATTTAGTGLTYSANAFNVNTSQNIATLSNLTGNGAILTSGGAGTLGTYAGTSCTNQFVRSLSGSIVATCATVGAGDVSLANLTATDSTLTFSGTYTGATARTIGINLGNPNTWTALQTITNASTTALTAGTFFQVPSGTAMTSLMQGALFFDTTSRNLLMGTTTSPSTTAHVVIGSATTTLYAFAISSTSPDFISGGTIELPAHFLEQTAIAVICEADAGTSVVINLSDSAATADSNTATCTNTSTQFQFTSNNSYAAYAAPRIEFGTITGAVDRLSVRIVGYRVSN